MGISHPFPAQVWRRRTLRVRASLRLCKVQWDRVYFARPDVASPLPDQLIDRALRNLIHSVHNQTTKKFGKLFGASILDKQENLFPTKELVEDEVMFRHIQQIEDYVKQGVPGWVVHSNEPNPGHVVSPAGASNVAPPAANPLASSAPALASIVDDARKTQVARKGRANLAPARRRRGPNGHFTTGTGA